MNRYIGSTKVAAPAFQSTRLLDQLRERVRYLHYSLSTEKAYLYWARFFIRWHGREGAMRHPRDMGQAEVETFLTMLAHERQVLTSIYHQALNALLFLYKQVLGQDLPWMQAIGRPPERKRVPVVLTVAEVQAVFALLDGVEGVLARLLYGTGMRHMEGLSLRVKDIDFDRHVIVVRDGKGGLRHPSAAGRHGHSHSAGAAGPQRCEHGHDGTRWRHGTAGSPRRSTFDSALRRFDAGYLPIGSSSRSLDCCSVHIWA